MGLPLALFVAGQALSTFARLNQNAAEADAARASAAFYREQQWMIQQDTQRELDIFSRKSTALQGDQKIAVGNRGTMINADDMMNLAYQRTLMDNEAYAIKRKGELEARMAGIRADQADQMASAYGNPLNTAMTITGGLLTGYSQFKG